MLINGNAYKVQQWPSCTVKPSILWMQDAAGYWNGSDRGVPQDAYEATAIFRDKESVINPLEQDLLASREVVALSSFGFPLFAPNVNHTGSISTIVQSMKRTQIQWAPDPIYQLEVHFRAIFPFLLSLSPSLSTLRLQSGFDAGHTNESIKAFSYSQAAFFSDHRSDVGVFSAPFSQSTTETQAILAYLLTTARANAFAFPVASVAYPWGRNRGSAGNCKVKSFSLSRKNLNRWTIQIQFVEAP